MSQSFNNNSENFDITHDEFQKLSNALKKEEFRKLFLDYCEEIQNPENRKQYESEIRQLEAERGVDVTFLNPEPGFVVKTSLDGESKCFLNIAKCDKICPPTSESGIRQEDGANGSNWSIPYGLPPPRADFDNRNQRCQVFDVVFHPNALLMAEKNAAFRRLLIQTACDGVEREYNVRLDRNNLKFPKLKFKGIQRASIIRKKLQEKPLNSDKEPSLLDDIMPPIRVPKDKPAKFVSPEVDEHDEYSCPKYVLKYSSPVDMSEMTDEIDAKLNITLPKMLVIEISLPLLKTTVNCTLDVTDKMLYFVSEKPAKYKLNINLPYGVNDKEGSAKFDSDKRKLVITLPLEVLNKGLSIKDLYRSESPVEGDTHDELVEIVDDTCPLQNPKEESEETSSSEEVLRNPFLRDSIEYTFPEDFDVNILDETLVIVLHVRNVDNESLMSIGGSKFFHLQFTSLGAGYYPCHYAFYFEFPDESSMKIDSLSAETLENNVSISLRLESLKNIEYYCVGLDKANLKLFRFQEDFMLEDIKQSKNQDDQSRLNVLLELGDDDKSVQIEITPRKANSGEEADDYNASES